MVERDLPKVDVASSNLVTRSKRSNYIIVKGSTSTTVEICG